MRISDWSSTCALPIFERAGDRARGSVAASDAFFPFADGLHLLLAAGVAAIVQPGGSVRDAEVVAARPAERRVWKECVSPCRSWWSPVHQKKHHTTLTLEYNNVYTKPNQPCTPQ